MPGAARHAVDAVPQTATQESPAPHQFHDLVPDGRCQRVPVCDQLEECLVLPAHFRPATKRHVVTIIGEKRCAN